MKASPPMPTGEWGSSAFHLRQVATILRFSLEVCAALSLLSWSSARLPDALRFSGFFFRRLSSVVVSTPFVFFVGNAIIVTLFVANTKSAGKAANPSSKGGVPMKTNLKTHPQDIYPRQLNQKQGLLAFVEGVDILNRHHHEDQHQHQDSYSQPLPVVDVHYEDKAVCLVEKSPPPAHTFRRTKSDHLGRPADFSKPHPELRRSVTDVTGASTKEHLLSVPSKKRARGQGQHPHDGAASRHNHYLHEMDVEPAVEEEAVDEEKMKLSDEELRRRVEAFIAKQIKFHREEEMSLSMSMSMSITST